jgi:hypothetical protein
VRAQPTTAACASAPGVPRLGKRFGKGRAAPGRARRSRRAHLGINASTPYLYALMVLGARDHRARESLLRAQTRAAQRSIPGDAARRVRRQSVAHAQAFRSRPRWRFSARARTHLSTCPPSSHHHAPVCRHTLLHPPSPPRPPQNADVVMNPSHKPLSQSRARTPATTTVTHCRHAGMSRSPAPSPPTPSRPNARTLDRQ